MAGLAVALIVPLTGAAAAAWNTSGTQLAAVRAERRGVQYLGQAVRQLVALADAQSAAVLGRAPTSADLAAMVAAVDSSGLPGDADPGTGSLWAQIRPRIMALTGSGGTGAAAYQAYSEVTDLILQQISAIDDASGLIRDPEADANHLVSALTVQLPDVAVEAGRFDDQVTLTGRAGRQSDDARAASTARLAVLRDRIAVDANAFAAELNKVFRSTGSATLGPHLLGDVDLVNTDVDALVPTASVIDEALAVPDAPTVSADRRAFDPAVLVLETAGLTELDSLLKTRESGYEQQRKRLVLLFLGGLVVAVPSAWWARRGNGAAGEHPEEPDTRRPSATARVGRRPGRRADRTAGAGSGPIRGPDVARGRPGDNLRRILARRSVRGATGSRRGLLIRHKLHLMVVIPLTGMLLATAPLVVERVDRASQATDLANLMKTADGIGALVQDVQRERLLSIAFLASPDASPNAVVVQSALVTGAAVDLRRGLGGRITPALSAALGEVDDLGPLRDQMLHQSITPNRLNAAYDSVVSALIDAIGLFHPSASDPAGDADQAALDALFRSDQYRGTVGAALLSSLAAPRGGAGALGTAQRATQEEAVEIARFKQLATPEQARLFRLAEFGTASALVDDLQGQIEAAHGTAADDEAAPASAADRTALLDRLSDAVTAQYGLRVLVEEKIARDIAADAGNAAHTETVIALGFGLAVEALVIIVILLSVSIRRSVSEPLRGLTEAAIEVADLADAELRRVADSDDAGPLAPMPRLAAVRVATHDEVGVMAEAFNRVQATSARLLERQILSRRNVAAMYGSIGRRTLNLVRLQLALIEVLEADEPDEGRREGLGRLDHTASRLRRSANSLIVLSGTPHEAGALAEPLSLRDAVLAAVSDIEHYQRVRAASVAADLLRPGPAGDVVLVLAELLANAVGFSPPESEVQVTSYRAGAGRYVRIMDRGIGMPAARIEEENTRLVSRERLDLAPTDLLGLFVVGRLARRRGLTVTLAETDGGGVTVFVKIPDALFLADADQPRDPEPDDPTGTKHHVEAAVQRAMTARSGDAGPDTASPHGDDPNLLGWRVTRGPGVARAAPDDHRTTKR